MCVCVDGCVGVCVCMRVCVCVCVLVCVCVCGWIMVVVCGVDLRMCQCVHMCCMLRCVKLETHVEAQDAKVAVDAKRGPDDFKQPGVGVVVHCLDKLFDHVQLSLPPPGVICVCVCVCVCVCACVCV